MWITGHCLIWHSRLPKWFCVDENGNNVSPDILKARMKNHIATLYSNLRIAIGHFGMVTHQSQNYWQKKKKHYFWAKMPENFTGSEVLLHYLI